MKSLSINFVGELPGKSSGDTFVISSEADYVKVSGLLRENLAEEYGAIWVRREHHFKWLDVQAEQCGLKVRRSMTFARTTPRSLLHERWGLEIPEWLTDAMILHVGLLETSLPAGATDVATALLNPQFGHLTVSFPANRAGFLAEKASEPAISELLATPVLAAAWNALLSRWDLESAQPWVKPFCERLTAEPKKLWSDLTTWRLLSLYPSSALDYALDPSAAAFVRSVPLDSVREMAMSPEGRRLALDQIEQIFETTKTGIVTHTKFRSLLDSASGELVEEFTGIESLLGNVGFDVAPADLAEIKRHFHACPGVSSARLSRLKLYVRPQKPDVETASYDAASWVRWSQEQYFPYRWWQIERRTADAEVERSVAMFSDWYCRNFPQVHSDAALSAVQTLSRWRERILSDRVSLILLVDNLPWFFWELLEKALAGAGLHRHESGATFVPLPSHTAVCKPLIVAGRADATGSDYLKMLTARSAEEWNSRQVRYLGGVDQLASLKPGPEPCVILLNYLAADEALHSDAEASGSSWSDQLDLLYGNLAQAVGDFARRVSASVPDIGIYVLTDHGSTFVLPEERLAADAQLSKKLFPNEKHRSATLTEAEANEIPENFWTLGYRFVSPFTAGVHFIPRGHNTVASPGARPIFCHGGATPEEIIVPHGVFRLYPANWTAPRLRFLGLDLSAGHARFYIKRIVPLAIEIQNANSEELRLESIALIPGVAEVRAFDAVATAPKSTQTASVSLYFSNEATNVSAITFNLSFRIGQDLISQKIELPVKITSAASGGVDLKNL
jgi:hypothetical protein